MTASKDETTGGLFARLRAVRPDLVGALGQVADYVLAEPSIAVRSTITELAERVGTSPGTITRFCRACDFGGYAELRVAIAEEIGRAANSRWDSDIGRRIDADDTLDHVLRVIVQANQQALVDTAEQLDLDVLDRVATSVITARQVHFFGVGTSAVTAEELRMRLQRIDVPSWAWQDVHSGLTSVALVDGRDVVVGISQSGRITETLEVLRRAAERGAVTVAITNEPASPLAEVASLVLTTAPRAADSRADAMADRHAQMLVMDVLYARIAQLTHARTLEALESTAEAMREHRVPPKSKPRNR